MIELVEIGGSVVGVALVWVLYRVLRFRALLKAALTEQARREKEHHLGYRHDQRVAAIQQRLSRGLKKRAFSTKVKRAIDTAIGKAVESGVLDRDR